MSKFSLLLGGSIPIIVSDYWLEIYDIPSPRVDAGFLDIEGFAIGENILQSRCSNGEPIHVCISPKDFVQLVLEHSSGAYAGDFSQRSIFGMTMIVHDDMSPGYILFVRGRPSYGKSRGSLKDHIISNVTPTDICLWRER